MEKETAHVATEERGTVDATEPEAPAMVPAEALAATAGPGSPIELPESDPATLAVRENMSGLDGMSGEAGVEKILGSREADGRDGETFASAPEPVVSLSINTRDDRTPNESFITAREHAPNPGAGWDTRDSQPAPETGHAPFVPDWGVDSVAKPEQPSADDIGAPYGDADLVAIAAPNEPIASASDHGIIEVRTEHLDGPAAAAALAVSADLPSVYMASVPAAAALQADTVSGGDHLVPPSPAAGSPMAELEPPVETGAVVLTQAAKVASPAAPAARASTTAAAPHTGVSLSEIPAAPETVDRAHYPDGVRRGGTRATLMKVLRFGVYTAGAYLALIVALIFIYRFVDPPASTLMLYQAAMGRDVAQQWVDIEDVSPQLVRAVLVAEDGQFCDHWGVDIQALEQAIERAAGGAPRGASTISMQVTKNLYLWQTKSYIRKAIELPLTLLMELIWPKRRILEVYLNIAEWAPGVFGVEAAARHHFNKAAGALGEREAAQLAASLPNPYRRDAGDPGPRTARKANVIQSRTRAEGRDVADCIYGVK